jgi:hypothetical protein
MDGPGLAIASLIIYGAFERHPKLRIGVIELTASWVQEFLPTLVDWPEQGSIMNLR